MSTSNYQEESLKRNAGGNPVMAEYSIQESGGGGGEGGGKRRSQLLHSTVNGTKRQHPWTTCLFQSVGMDTRT